MATSSQELSCKELVELLTDYLEGRLSTDDVARFDEHLVICEGCRIYLNQMQTTLNTLGKLSEESIPPQAKAELLRTFRSWRAPEAGERPIPGSKP
jgi:predicted anti-sigma-YlaC factor YlaD